MMKNPFTHFRIYHRTYDMHRCLFARMVCQKLWTFLSVTSCLDDMRAIVLFARVFDNDNLYLSYANTNISFKLSRNIRFVEKSIGINLQWRTELFWLIAIYFPSNYLTVMKGFNIQNHQISFEKLTNRGWRLVTAAVWKPFAIQSHRLVDIGY